MGNILSVYVHLSVVYLLYHDRSTIDILEVELK
jgi:hypothetical protein